MKILSSWSSSERFVLKSLLISSLFLSVAKGGRNLDQDGSAGRRIDGDTVSIFQYTEIPEATEPCTPAVCEWWKEVRKTGNNLQKRSDKKSKAKFLLLLREGSLKGYRIPLKDRLPQSLVIGKLTFPDEAQRITGTLALSIEFRADGSVGDVQIIRTLALGIDENVVRAVRQCIFLPAIENGAFVTARRTAEFESVSHQRK